MEAAQDEEALFSSIEEKQRLEEDNKSGKDPADGPQKIENAPKLLQAALKDGEVGRGEKKDDKPADGEGATKAESKDNATNGHEQTADGAKTSAVERVSEKNCEAKAERSETSGP